MKCFVLLFTMVFCACSPKPKVEDVGLSEEAFRTLHYQVLYDFFGGQGFDQSNLVPHSHQLMELGDVQKIFKTREVELAGALFVDCKDREDMKISTFLRAGDLDDKTRALNETETAAIDSLFAKKTSYAGYSETESRKEGPQMRSFMWPVRAMNETCIACHGGEKGRLLGAVVYQFPE